MAFRVLFQSQADGLGHISRLSAIAQALIELDPGVHALMLGGRVLPPWQSTLPYLSLPTPADFQSSRWLRWGAPTAWSVVDGLVVGLLEGFRPHLGVYDTLIWPAIQSRVAQRPIQQALVLRNRMDLVPYFNRHAPALTSLDAILLVSEVAGGTDAEEVWPSLPSNVRQVAPIVRHNRMSLRPDAARQRYRVSASQSLVVITVGAGGAPEAADILREGLAAVGLSRHELGPCCVIAVAGPEHSGDPPKIALGEDPDLRVTLISSDPNLSDLFAAARVTICASGYNTLAEVVDVGVPAVCVPGPRRYDDCASRVRALAAAGHDIHLAEARANSIAGQLQRILHRPPREFEPGPSRFGGAKEAAGALHGLLAATGESAWHNASHTRPNDGARSLEDPADFLRELTSQW